MARHAAAPSSPAMAAPDDGEDQAADHDAPMRTWLVVVSTPHGRHTTHRVRTRTRDAAIAAMYERTRLRPMDTAIVSVNVERAFNNRKIGHDAVWPTIS